MTSDIKLFRCRAQKGTKHDELNLASESRAGTGGGRGSPVKLVISLSVAQPQRVLGADISYWDCPQSATKNFEITQSNWTYACSPAGGNRVFVQLRSSRGGVYGLDQPQGTPYPGGSQVTDQHRYDDPRFYQNLRRALAAGMQVGPYHRGQEDSTTGADEADHMIQVAGPWMRPGYTVPMLDWEDGGFNATQAQWAIDFSDEIYAVMKIRPCVYIGGANSAALDNPATVSLELQAALAKPATLMPSVIGVRFYMLWNPRYTNVDWQVGNPKDSYSGFYGPWDDYVTDPHPWSFWQYSSTIGIPGLNGYHNNDNDICHGDIEYLRNYLVPAVWWNDSDGDWGTTNNWNCGQSPPTITWGTNQAAWYESPALTLPDARLPGTGGTNAATLGQYDTVILERPNPITVTLSSGTCNIRKLYMRETLNLTGGSLTINYNPAYRPDDTPTCVHAGPISAQFSGPVTLSGSATLNVNTLQVDAGQTFTLNGGSLAFNGIGLMPDSVSPAKIAVGGTVTFSAVSGSSATITNGAGAGTSGSMDLTGGTRSFNVASGVDLFVEVAVIHGGITKAGSGTMHLDKANTYSGGTTVSAGTLEVGPAGSVQGNVTNSAGTLKLDSASTMSSGATLALAGSPAAGAVNLGFSGTQTNNALYFGTVQQAAGTWGAIGNASAGRQSAAFTGTGILRVTTGALPPSTTTVSRTSGFSPSTYGNSLTFTATVTGNSPTGTVQFKVNGAAQGGPLTLVGGSAALVTNSLPVTGSPHQITAYYSGDANNAPSDSSASPVSQAITAKTLTAGLTGTVAKTYDGTTTAALTAGNYSLPGVLSADTVYLNNPTGGTYDTKDFGSGKLVTVTGLAISGASSANYSLPLTSASASIGVITALTTSCSVTSSVNPSGPGTNVTFTATVAGVPPATDRPTSNVVFAVDAVPFATNALSGGITSASLASPPPGTNAITAMYVGDGNFLAGTASMSQVVQSSIACSLTNALLGVADNGDGTFTLTFVGTPQSQYCVVAAAAVTAPPANWLPVAGSTNTVTNANGLWQFRVTNTAPFQFYRSKAAVLCQ